MDPRLTIRVPQDVLDEAKRYAKRKNTTLTRLVSEYLCRLTREQDFLAEAPTVQRLLGSLSQDVSEQDYRRQR